MFEHINLLFGNGTVEDDRDSLVLQTICTLIEKRLPTYSTYTIPDITAYCLGVSIDAIHEALPLTMGLPTAPECRTTECRTTEYRPALSIYQVIQSLDRLTTERGFLRNDDAFEVIHLRTHLLYDLSQAMDAELVRLAESIARQAAQPTVYTITNPIAA